jgi:DNA-binding NarL/FixJ family response regulator
MTDHKLPDASGVELIAKIRATGFTGPVLLVTGNDDPKVHAGAMAAGATKVLSGTRPGFAEAFAALLPCSPPETEAPPASAE